MDDLENLRSFNCFDCQHENFYRPSDYIDEKREGELLLEMKTFKVKEVIISCSNNKCSAKNSISINYY